jgi:SAM-dependent methyltransferase
MLASGRPLFAGVHERLFFRERYAASSSFVEVVENRSGVIGVTADGSVYGSGVYDGVYNVDPGRFGLGQIHHAYGIGAFHPAPRRVLMIGLGAGSWGTIVANHPSVEQVVIVEINPGYVQLLSRHAAVAGLATHPKAEFAIADGRRWLQRHSGEQFDLVIAHTVYDWRANASSLLSVEFMQLIGRHLAPGGLYYFFSTSDPRVQKTAAVVFPHAWRVADMMVVGDAPIHMDFDRLRRQMADFRIDGRRVLDLSIDEDGATLTRMLDFLETDLESREAILARTSALLPVTDDNMGTEWRLPKRYRLF